MDFGIYPPEINSGRMYAGPGSGPLLAAAQTWAELADELYMTASSYQSVVSELTAGSWSGPSSASMTAAATSHVQWLSTTAVQAEETANQATAAVAAYEAAFALTVPPPVIAANRSLLATLVATNFFGQNTAAIAATEAQYAEMWAQDAAAMYTYAGSSAAAMVLTPFTSPRQNTDTGGTAAQAAAAIQATDAPAGNAQSIVSGVAQTFSAVPDAVQSLAAAAPAASSSSTLGTLSDLITIFVGVPTNLASLGVGLPLDLLGAVDLPFSLGGYVVGTHVDDIVSGWNGEQSWPSTDPAPVRGFPATLMKLSPGTLSAGLGQANTVGGLSVPSAWTVAAPELRPAALALPIGSTSPIAAAPMELGSSTSLSQMGLAGMTGRAMAGAPSSGEANDGRKVIGSPVVVRPGGGAADSDGEASHAKPRIVVTGVAAKIRELSKLRDEGDLTDEEYAQLKKHLLGR